MKSVLISVQPQWCELIASGKKTIEVRKTRPKIVTPFKCYIYATKSNRYSLDQAANGNLFCWDKKSDHYPSIWFEDGEEIFNGKVIGEFVCDETKRYHSEFWDDETYERIQEVYEPQDFAEYGEYEYETIAEDGEDNQLCKDTCLTWVELRAYIGQDIKEFYGWHISDLKIYDKPKELGEFWVKANPAEGKFSPFLPNRHFEGNNYQPLIRPPQSWCYVEEIK